MMYRRFWVAAFLLLYRGLLGLYPRRFKDDAGRDLVASVKELFESAWEARGFAAALRQGFLEVADLVMSAPSEWGAEGHSPSGWRHGFGGGRKGGGTMDSLARDVRYAWRSMRRHPLFAATVVGTLALTIGGNATMFGVLDAVLLTPLPYPEADAIVYMTESFREDQTKSVSYLNYLDWKERNSSFEDVGAQTDWGFTLTGSGDARELQGMLLTSNALDVLGVATAIGRGFSAAEVANGERVALLSDGLWRSALGADRGVVGRTLTLDGEPFTVVGVMPAGLEFPLKEADVWAPITMLSERDRGSRGSHPGMSVLARLREGISVETARADMDAIARQLAADYPETNAEAGVRMELLRDRYVGSARPVIYMLMGAVLLVLLIAVTNVASLFLVRATTRARESAVRVALGSGRGRLLRQMLAESLMLSLVGGGLGLLLAATLMNLVRRVQPGGLPRLESVTLDGSVVLFTIGLVILAGVAFGSVPAFQAGRMDPGASLRGAGGRGTDGRSTGRLRGVFVITQVAMAFVLLNGAGLMIRSVVNLLEESPGLETADRLAADVLVPQAEYPTVEDRARFYGQLLDRVAALPGVERVAGVAPLPFSRSNRQRSISSEGFPTLDANGLRTDWASVTPGYFRTMGIPVLAGAEFTGDERSEAPAAIVDETLAERLWPGAKAVGRRFKFRGADSPWITVVGVVGHVKHYGIKEDSRVQVYMPYTVDLWGLTLVAHTTGDPGALVPALRRELADLDPDVPLGFVTSMDDLFGRTIGQEELAMRTLAIFAGVALILALMGLYGVVSYSVSLRTREIGVRMALGADGKRVLGQVLAQGLALSLSGVILGIVGALGAVRVLSSLLFGVQRSDPLTLAWVSGVMILVAVVGAGLPALRATRVSPTVALRAE